MEATPYQQAVAHLERILLVVQPQLKNMERIEVEAVKLALEFVLDERKKSERKGG